MTRSARRSSASRSLLLPLAVLVLAAVAGARATDPAPAGAAPPVEAPPSARQEAPGDSARAMDRGRRLTGWLLAGRSDSVAAVLDSAFRAQLGGADGVGRFAVRLDRQLGSERGVVAEEVFTDRTVHHYYRISRFERAGDRTVTVHWAWREGGPVVGMKVSPTPRPAETGNEGYETKTRLRLPFEDAWYVAWGGRPPRRNYHARAPDQRFAYDFLVLRDGSSHRGGGRENADYHCFGRPVLAPAPGRVVRAADSVPDNVPGEMNQRAIFGNHVVIDHGAGEFSVLAHLRRGSVTVEPGDRVERGQRLGACGNSGRSSEPHLHYHLQDGPEPGGATGLPAAFRGYRADGEVVERGEPTRGRIVRPASPGAAGRAPSAGTGIASVQRAGGLVEPFHEAREARP